MSCSYNDFENDCPTAFECDTLLVSFELDIEPIINQNCFSCHSGSAPSGNVLLENYTQVSDSIYKIIEVISLEENSSNLMPPGGKLPNCSIEQIEQWIEDGMPN